MLDSKKMKDMLDLQTRSYALLKWVATQIEEGRLSYQTVHNCASKAQAAKQWIEHNYGHLPEKAKPKQDDMDVFANLFSTYLENSFELVEKPGQYLYSPNGHCFCPMCSWLVNASHLRAKKPTSIDKKRARNLMHQALNRIAQKNEIVLKDETAEKLFSQRQLQEPLALSAYVDDLCLKRVHGIATGPAVLVLWRQFAWLPTGSPKKNFNLTTEMILNAETTLKNELMLNC